VTNTALRDYDARVRRQNMVQLLLALVSVVLGLALLEFSWDYEGTRWREETPAECAVKALLSALSLAQALLVWRCVGGQGDILQTVVIIGGGVPGNLPPPQKKKNIVAHNANQHNHATPPQILCAPA
jgi:hypothetical protein